MCFKWNDQIIGTTWDRAGQLGESGEYRMGRSVCGLFYVQSSEGPPESIKDWSSGLGEQVRLCTDAYGIYGVLQT
jgi:hypothetical protein